MSVINQVLRDLDKRQRTAQGARVRSHYQPASGRPWGWLLIVGAAIVLSVAATWWLVAYAFASPEPLAGNQLQEAQADQSQQQSTQGEVQPSGVDAENQHNLPAEPLSPGAKVIVPEQPTLQPTASKGAGVVAAQRSEENQPGAATPAVSPEVVVPAQGYSVQDAGAQTNASAQDDDSTQAEESRGEMSVQRVERSATELAAQRLEQAIDAMESGEGRKAESLLQEALVLAPGFIDARQQLAAYYYGRGFTSEALRVLREGLAHAPEDLRLLTLSARIYEDSGRADEALAMLNRIDAKLPQQNNVVVLRAALANELGQFQIAAADYRQLLGINPNQGIWWLGLAVAEEGLANYEAARLAYQRAGEDTGLDRASREYARNREEAIATW